MPPRFPVGADAITEPDPRLLAQMQGQQAPRMGAQMGVAGAFQGAGALTPSPIAQDQRVLATPAIRESMMRQATPQSALTAPAGSEALPVAPLATAPTRPQQSQGRHQAAGPGTPEQAHDAMRNLLQGKFQEMGMVVDDARLEELTKFAVAKRKERLQYRATKGSVFRLKFRHQYPTMSEEEIEILVNDAVEEGLRKEAPPSFGGPVMSPPISCTSSRIGSYTYTDCY